MANALPRNHERFFLRPSLCTAVRKPAKVTSSSFRALAAKYEDVCSKEMEFRFS